MRSSTGEVIGVIGTYVDITERKRAETILKEKEYFLSQSQRLAHIGSWGKNLTGPIEWSEETYRLYGVSPATFIPTFDSINDLIHPEDRQAMKEWLVACREGQSPGSLEYRRILPDGSVYFLSGTGDLVGGSDGKPAYMAGTVQDITKRKQELKEIQSRAEVLTMLYQLSRTLSDATDLEDVIELVTRSAVECVRTTFAFIFLLVGGDLVSQPIYPIRTLGHGFTFGERRSLTVLPVCERVLNKNEPVILQAGNLEISKTERAALQFDFAQTVCLVPLRVGNPSQQLSQPLGLLVLGEMRQEKREPFTSTKIHLARNIGDQAASAIRRMLLYEQAGRRLKHLSALSEIDRTISTVFDLQISLGMILKQVCEQLETDAADVLIYSDRLQTLKFVAERGFLFPCKEHRRLRLGEGQAGQAVLDHQFVQLPDIAACGAVFAQSDQMISEQFAAYFAMPLIVKEQVKGVLEIYNRTPLTPTEEWLDFLKILAGQTAIAIDNIQLFENLKQSNTELTMAYDATIVGWADALELRDQETLGSHNAGE